MADASLMNDLEASTIEITGDVIEKQTFLPLTSDSHQEEKVLAPIERLPTELHDGILNLIHRDPKVRKNTLLAVCSVSKTLRQVTIPFLYTHILAGFQLGPLVRTLTKYPDLARTVKTLELTPDYYPLGPADADELKYFTNATSFLKPHTRFLKTFKKNFRRGYLPARLAVLCLLCGNLERLVLPCKAGTGYTHWITRLLELKVAGRVPLFEKLSSIIVHWNDHCHSLRPEDCWDMVNQALKIPSIKSLDVVSSDAMVPSASNFNKDRDLASNIQNLTLRGDFFPMIRSLVLRRCNQLSSLTVTADFIDSMSALSTPLNFNKSTLQHLTIHSLYADIDADFSGISSVFPELHKLQTLQIDSWMIDGGHSPKLSFSRLPPNLKSLTISTESHPQYFFPLLETFLSEASGAQSLTSFHSTYYVERHDSHSFLCEKLLRDHLDLSLDMISLSSALVRCGKKTHAAVTIDVKPVSRLAIDLHQGQIFQPGSQNFSSDGLAPMRPRLASNESTSAKDVMSLWERLETYRTVLVRETENEKEERQDRLRRDKWTAREAAAAKKVARQKSDCWKSSKDHSIHWN